MHPYLRAALLCIAIAATVAFWSAVFYGCAPLSESALATEQPSLASITIEHAELINGKCGKCALEMRTSKVYLNAYGTTTLASCGGGHYDERGAFVPPSPCNTSSRGWQCSNGHSGVETWASY